MRFTFATRMSVLLWTALLVIISSSRGLAASPPSFKILTAGPITITFDPRDRPQKSELSLLIGGRTSNKPLHLRVSPILYDAVGKDASSRVRVSPSRTTISPKTYRQHPLQELSFTVTLARGAAPVLGPGDTLSGYLLLWTGIRSGGSIQTVALSITANSSTATKQGDLIVGGIGNFFRWWGIYSWATAIITAAALVLGLFLVATVLSAWCRKINLLAPMTAKFEWDTTKSWLSVLTGTGAILGTILAASVLPSQPVFLPKQVYGGLNVFFGLILLVPPLIYSLFQDRQAQHGLRWIFVLASGITVGAVAGELLTTLVLVPEIIGNTALSLAATNVFRAFLLALLILAPIYGLLSALRILSLDEKTRLYYRSKETYDHALAVLQAAQNEPQPPANLPDLRQTAENAEDAYDTAKEDLEAAGVSIPENAAIALQAAALPGLGVNHVGRVVPTFSAL